MSILNKLSTEENTVSNICENSFLIKGPIEKISKLWKSLEDRHFQEFLSVLLPTSNDSPEFLENYWGTKGETDVQLLEFTLKSNLNKFSIIQGCFDTAWSPPIKAFQHWFFENPDCYISLDYHESLSFAGSWSSSGFYKHWENIQKYLTINTFSKNIDLVNTSDSKLNEIINKFELWTYSIDYE